jgi:hypothetical protein
MSQEWSSTRARGQTERRRNGALIRGRRQVRAGGARAWKPEDSAPDADLAEVIGADTCKLATGRRSLRGCGRMSEPAALSAQQNAQKS